MDFLPGSIMNWRMKVLIALLALWMVTVVEMAIQLNCTNPLVCSCGSTDKNITICQQNASEDDPCRKWSKCKICQDGLDSCLHCEDGFEGSFCSTPSSKSRQKRQNYYTRRRPNLGNPINYCTNLESPKFGSIRCVSKGDRRTCHGNCLPGYSFVGYESQEEIILTCRRGEWTPIDAFPPCVSGGHCDLVVEGSGSFNCTTRMTGTLCDVTCNRWYEGRYFCNPGHPWSPSLPHCVRPKGVSEVHPICRCENGGSCNSNGNCVCPTGMTGTFCETRVSKNRRTCRCRNGGNCDRNGKCVCPTGRTGTFCETIIPEKQKCRDPGFISNGYRTTSDGYLSEVRQTFEEGDYVMYVCTSQEFELQGYPVLTCRSDGWWSGDLPKCIAKPDFKLCSDPGEISNGHHHYTTPPHWQGFLQGTSVEFSCNEGYDLIGKNIIYCLDSGEWSDSLPKCQPQPRVPVQPSIVKFCKDPGDITNGNRQYTKPRNQQEFLQGSSVKFSCNQGFDLIGKNITYCLDSGEWSDIPPTCQSQSRVPVASDGDSVNCPDPGLIPSGRIVYKSNLNSRRGEVSRFGAVRYSVGSQLQYSCIDRYSLKGASLLTCEESGDWSSDPPKCQEDTINYCPNPGSVANGRMVLIESLDERRGKPAEPVDDLEEEFPEGSQLEYSCDRGYAIEGVSKITCKTSGQWSAKRPRCISVGDSFKMHCRNPGSILNGRVDVIPPGATTRSTLSEEKLEYPEGTQLEYTCDDGYFLQGSDSLRCQSTGHWSTDIRLQKCVTDCGLSFVQTNTRVTGGEKTINGEWPWVVAITRMENKSPICGGAVINSQTVLTAAHCLNKGERYKLYFGTTNPSAGYENMRISTATISHPDYNEDSMDSDIGLIKFTPKVQFSNGIQPICLPTGESTAKNFVTGKLGHVSGWGYTELDRQSNNLLHASLPYLSNEQCIESYGSQNIALNLTTNMFCAGHEDGRQSTCDGDSGSALVFQDRLTRRYTVEGVVSFGVEGACGLSGRFQVFTKVVRFLDWIYRNWK